MVIKRRLELDYKKFYFLDNGELLKIYEYGKMNLSFWIKNEEEEEYVGVRLKWGKKFLIVLIL